jgi:predicted transcriptional regulator
LGKDLNDFKNIQKEIKFLTNSDNRLKILHCLLNSPQTLKGIHERTGLNNSSISINVSSLESNGYVVNRNDIFYLTNASKLILTNIFYLNKSVNFLDRNADFFNMHKLDNLKFNALKDISSLESSELVESTPFDIFKTVRLYKEFGFGSKSIRTIFPYMYPQINELFADWFENDVEIKLILDKDVSDAFTESFNNYKFDKESDSKISVKTIEKGLDFALFVTDEVVILGFYKADGKFDQNAVYISKEKEAILWGKDIFEEYENLAPEYIYLKE